MKSDIDALMQSRGVDALLVTGPALHNPSMVYFTGVAHVTHGILVKKCGEPPVLFASSMERDEAARTGLETRSMSDFRLDLLLKETGGDHLKANALLYRQLFSGLGLETGRVALYGLGDTGAAYALFTEVQRLLPDLELVGEFENPLLLNAMATKDESEVEHIRHMGRITVDIAANIADFLTSHAVRDEVLVKSDGSPLTIGEVKSRIDLLLAERGAENPEGTIFAIGRDAGVPHSSGTAGDPIRLGRTIVFDFFPRQAGGGFFYDFTRTWCLGYAPDEALAVYEDVLAVYKHIIAELRPGEKAKAYQELCCDLFEQRGHPTIKSDPTTEQGYVHSLGHGVGLRIHERPTFSVYSRQEDTLVPGSVFTVEPGLYYPDRGLGVRIEDTVYLRPDGRFEILAEYPYDLVLPMKG